MPRFKTNNINSVEEDVIPVKADPKPAIQNEDKVIEREINLSLLNDKLNYIIARLEEFED